MNTYLITGSSYGIGSAITHDLLCQGHDVYSISRTLPATLNAATEGHATHTWTDLDLTDIDKLEKYADDLVTLKAKFDGFIVNASIQNRTASQWNHSEMLRHMDTNCFSQCQLYEFLLQREVLTPNHRCVVMTSEAATNGSKWAVSYAMSKAALECFFRSKNLRRSGNPVLFFKPGRVNTPGNPKRRLDPGDPNQFYEPEEIIEPIMRFLNMHSNLLMDELNFDLGQ